MTPDQIRAALDAACASHINTLFSVLVVNGAPDVVALERFRRGMSIALETHRKVVSEVKDV